MYKNNNYKHNQDGTTTIYIKTTANAGRHKWRNPEGIFEVLVDSHVFEDIQTHKWGIIWNNNKHYVRAGTTGSDGKRKNLYLHRMLTGAAKGMDVDHIDGGGMNNTSANLRVCTRSQNNMNRGNDRKGHSKYKGVRYDKRAAHTKPWGPFIQIEGKTHNGPRQKTDLAAAIERDMYALRILGHEGFIFLNFPEKQEAYLEDIAAGRYTKWRCEG